MASVSNLPPLRLTGTAWDHMRGFVPKVATAQAFHDANPDVEIAWSKRTLHEFGHAPVEALAAAFDLIVLDHPFVGELAARRLVYPLDDLVSRAELAELAADSCGLSFPSYSWDGQSWAFPIDAAAPAAVWHPGKLGDTPPPTRWRDVLSLARSGRVILANFHADCFLNWLGMTTAFGGRPGAAPDRIVERAAGTLAAECLQEASRLADPRSFEANPIAVCRLLASDDRVAYCPTAFTYGVYGAADYQAPPLKFGDPPALGEGKVPRTILGGTGLAISTRCTGRVLDAAVRYARYVASRPVQAGLYIQSGGQPARASAWAAARERNLWNGFFADTAGVMERAIMRPRFTGFVAFQGTAGAALQAYLRGEIGVAEALERLDAAYRACRAAPGAEAADASA